MEYHGEDFAGVGKHCLPTPLAFTHDVAATAPRLLTLNLAGNSGGTSHCSLNGFPLIHNLKECRICHGPYTPAWGDVD